MLPVLLAAAALFCLCYLGIGLLRNIAAARRSGLPYLIVPCEPLNLVWLTFGAALAPLIRLLPQLCWESWLDLMSYDASYKLGPDRFKRHGDAFLLVSPGAITIHIADAEAVRQILSSRDRFPKPAEIYHALKLFGKNVVTTEGDEWKIHRRATGTSFNEHNAALAFREVVAQTQGMMSGWARGQPLTSISSDITRLTINVISYVGFGLRLLWPGQTVPKSVTGDSVKYSTLETPVGYSMSFVDTLINLMDSVVVLIATPLWLLPLLPFKPTRVASAARGNFVKYMDKMMDEKMDMVRQGITVDEGMDLMGQLIRGSRQADKTASPPLTRQEILGNAFIMFVAGHETSANTIHLSLILLATNPAAQRMLHKDLDRVVGSTDPSTWEYNNVIAPLLVNAVGACMNETLRLIPPAPSILKRVSPKQDQTVHMAGRDCVLPRNSKILLHALLVHEDAQHWPHRDDVMDYRPERWLDDTYGEKQDRANGCSEKGDGDSDSSYFLRPERGAFVPFSDGARSCLGRRLAQVEVLTTLAVLLQHYSLELVTDEWASEHDVDAMDRQARASVYRHAQVASRKTLSKAINVITLGLQGETVPMRLVRRGEERFVDWMVDA